MHKSHYQLQYHGNTELNLDLSIHNKSNVLEKCQNTGYIFCILMCRELISLLNGTNYYEI